VVSVGGTRFEAARVLFVDSSTSATSSFASRVVASDLDGDGDVDLALSLVDDSTSGATSSGATSSGATSSVNGGRLVLLQSMLGFAPPTQAPSPPLALALGRPVAPALRKPVAPALVGPDPFAVIEPH